ncbi:MAG: hypothetical protein AB7V62_08905 [Thermoleophilia bacterium]
MRGTSIGRVAAAVAIGGLAVALAACGGESTAQRTVTVTSAASVPAPPPATTAPVVTAPPVTSLTEPEPLPTATVSTVTAPAEPTTPADPEILVERPADFPNGGEQFLLARLEPDIQRRCTRESDADRSRGSVAGLICETASAYGARSYYELFRSRRGLEVSYGRYRSANGVPVARGECAPAGGGGRVPGDGTWGFGPSAPTKGRLMCFRSNGNVWFITSVESINVLAFATAKKFGDVDRFWRSVGVPSEQPQ